MEKNFKLNHLKKSNGITLIALVVTIIVLIILAGISINLILGDNGIITKAQLAKQVQEKADIIETLQLEIAAKEAEKLQTTNGITVAEIEEILSKYGTVNKEGDTIVSLTPTDKDYEIPYTEIFSGKTIEPEGDDVVDVSEIERGIFVEYDVEYTDTYYSDYKYTSTNGWRLLNYKTREDGKTLYDVELISTGIPARMYYYNDDTTNNYSKWVTDDDGLEAFKTVLGSDYNYYTGDSTYYALQASAGYYNNLGEMTFTQGTSYDTKNMGYYTSVTNGDTSYTTGSTLGNNLFKTSIASKVRMMTLPELNTALGITDIDSTSRISDSTGLFRLDKLINVLSGNSYSNGYYWLASPYPSDSDNVCSVAYHGSVNRSDRYYGVRPVVSLTSDIQLVEAVDSNGVTYYEIANN